MKHLELYLREPDTALMPSSGHRGVTLVFTPADDAHPAAASHPPGTQRHNPHACVFWVFRGIRHSPPIACHLSGTSGTGPREACPDRRILQGLELGVASERFASLPLRGSAPFGTGVNTPENRQAANAEQGRLKISGNSGSTSSSTIRGNERVPLAE